MEMERFIISVRNRASIWDQRLSDHHNRYVLDRLWKEVSEENKCTVKDAQSKWKSLRDYYRKEFRKIQLHRSADGAETIYSTSWPYFKPLDFLKDQFTPSQSSGTLKRKRTPNDSETTEASVEGTSEELEWDITSQNHTRSSTGTADGVQSPQMKFEVNDGYSPGNMAYDTDNREHVTAHHTFTRPNAFQKNAQKGKNIHLQSLIDIEKRKVCILEENMAKSKDDVTPDEDQSFFASLLPHVRIIKGLNKILFRNEVQNLIIKYAYSGSVTSSCAATSSGSMDSSLRSCSTAEISTCANPRFF